MGSVGSGFVSNKTCFSANHGGSRKAGVGKNSTLKRKR